MNAAPAEITDFVVYQVGALRAIAKAEGLDLQHVKPHGALYNMSAFRKDIAEAIARAVASVDDSLFLMGPPASELLSAGARLGLRVLAEGFVNRAYEADGSLTSRAIAGAVLTDSSVVADRAVRMVRDRAVAARDGSNVSLQVETICVHGDTPDAATLASAVRLALAQAGVQVAAPGTV